MSKLIGYLDGADSYWLTALAVAGCYALPLSNGWDGHGLNIQLLHGERKPDLVIGYLHKLIPTPDADMTINDLLYRTKVFNIPVFIVCPKELHEKAREIAPDLPPNAELVDPFDVVEKARALLCNE
ncbi:MAG: hypothetical protein HRF49_11440 [bacterium]